MKKTLSILLAMTMLFAVCVPVFAADNKTTVSAPGTYQATVTVLEQTSGGTGAEEYTLSFPANTDIYWEDTAAKDISYEIAYRLKAGASLDVYVTHADVSHPNGTDKVTMAADKTTDTLELTVKNLDKKDTYKGACAGTVGNLTPVTGTTPLNVQITTFAQKTVANYQTTFTYHLDYNAAA